MVQTSAGIVGHHNLRAISYESPASIGETLSALSPAALSTITWISGQSLYVPFQNLYRSTVYEVSWQNGTGTGGNVDAGIFDRAGNKLASLGTTARGTASAVITSTTWTDYVMEPGWYYLGFGCDSAAIFNGTALAAGLYQACGVVMATGTGAPLPSPASLVATNMAMLPLITFTLQNVTIT